MDYTPPCLPYPHGNPSRVNGNKACYRLVLYGVKPRLGEMRMAAARHVVRRGETRVLDRLSCSLSDNALMLLRCERRGALGTHAQRSEACPDAHPASPGRPRRDKALDRNGGGKGIEIESAPGGVLRIRDVVDARPQLEIFDGDVAGIEI